MAIAGRAGRLPLLLLAVLLLACTSDDGSPAPSTGAAPAAMRIGIDGPVVDDPQDASLASPTDLMVLDILYDGLTTLDDDGAAQPALAASWRANDTSTAFRFQLDPAATFASGRAITPDDVIASLERIMATGDTSLSALSLEAVSGFSAFAAGEADHVSGLSAPDDATVRIGLEAPLAVLPEVLSNPVLGVVDPDSLDAGGTPDLSGDWSVASDHERGLDLEPRPDHGSGPYGVQLTTFESASSAYDAFEEGDLDWAAVPPERFGDALSEHGEDAFAPFQAEVFFGLNVNRASLEDPEFRAAIVQAIDTDSIVADVYADLADELSAVVPAGVAGHDADRCSECGFDPEAAAAAVDETFPDGDVPTIHIDFDESGSQAKMAEQVAADLEEVGIPTELRPLPLEEYKSFVVSGDQELFSFGWIGAYASPDAYLSPLFGSDANDNLTGYRSRRVDGLLDRARAGQDPDKDAARWAAAETDVLDAFVVVPIAQFRTQAVVSDRVEGLQPAVDGTVDWTQVTLTG